jgi:hypothetical protein
LYIWGVRLTPAAPTGAYGTLAVADTVPDRELRQRLEAQGFTGIISESGQWVLVDSFGTVERVALDEYPARILPFDPRNDGYAQKLRSLFVRDEQRFLYIPLTFPVGVENRLAAALGDIPFSFHAASGLPASLFFALFCLTALSFFFIRPLRVMLRPHAACLLPLLPALAPLALAGAAGFAMASLLAGCAAILAGPYLEWHLTLSHRPSARAGQTPPALCRLLPPMFLIFYGVIAFFSGLQPLFIIPVSVFFCVLMVLQIRDAYREAASGGDAGLWGLFFKKRQHTHRFLPVPILSRRLFPFAFSWVMLPFAVVAFALACAGLSAPEPAPLFPPADTVTEADYYSHYWSQSTFSFRSLNAPDHDMSIYELAPDGLLNESKILLNESSGGIPNDDGTEFSPVDIPPFPLGEVLRYLNTPGRTGGGIHMLLAALLPLLFVFPILFRGGWLINQTYSGTLLKRFA